MFIQDSYYYQAFSYVVRIDEQLQSYASVVRSMLHPSGMALFGEYSIDNQIDLSIALEVMIKSLGITLYDELFPLDVAAITLYKDVSDAIEIPGGGSSILDQITRIDVDKVLEDSFNTPIDLANLLFGKGLTELVVTSESLTPIDTTKRLDDVPIVTEVMTRSISTSISESYSNFTENYSYSFDKPLSDTQVVTETISAKEFAKLVTDVNVATVTESLVQELGKSLEDTYSSTSITEVLTRSNTKVLEDTPVVTEQIANELAKYVTDTSIGTFTESGYITKNPYDEGGYFLEIYANPYESTF